MQAFGSLIEEKVEPQDCVMQWVPLWRIDTKDLCAAGAFLKVGDVMLGKLVAQVETDHGKLGCIAHGCFVWKA